ncbi:MAG: hypothetical protein JW894_12855 [Bacteroidales bacterium]|nr:hypothetical protein [Bacteroidales bacterium]
MDTKESDTKKENKIELSTESIENLDQTRKWAGFLAILGFVFIGLMVLAGFSMGAIMSTLTGDIGTPVPTFLFGFIYLVFAVIYFFPVLYLFRFSAWTKKAIHDNDSNNINLALRNLKAHYQYIGILTIIILAMYLLILIFFLIVKATVGTFI